MLPLTDLYLTALRELHAALYRVQFPPDPLFPESRLLVDVVLYPKNGVNWIVANGNGASLFDHVKPWMKRPGRNVYRFAKTTPIPRGLLLSKDMRPGQEGHYMIAPVQDMPVSVYTGLLEQQLSNSAFCQMLSIREVEDALARKR